MSSPLEDAVDRIIGAGQDRKFYIGIANKQTNAAGALVRLKLGWSPQNPDAEAIKERATRITTCGLYRKIARDGTVKRKSYHADDEEIGAAIDPILEATAKAIEVHVQAREVVEKAMKKAVRDLPVSAFASDIRGLGELGLAVIIAEAGDLARYNDVRKVWKRLGLAPFEGHAYSFWRKKGGLTKEQWTEAGYCPRRRAEIYACVGEPLIRAQKPGMRYRDVYDRRRVRTAETHPEWNKAHSHGDALRVMTKSLIFDLWSEWRRPCGDVARDASNLALASAELLCGGERIIASAHEALTIARGEVEPAAVYVR